MPNWEGVIASIVTPLKNRGSEADADTMRGYCDFILNKGVNGIFALGTTGEGPLLSLSEKKLLAETVVDQVNKRIPVIVHTGCITTDETIELTRFCKDIQVDAASIFRIIWLLPEINVLCLSAAMKSCCRPLPWEQKGLCPDRPVLFLKLMLISTRHLKIKVEMTPAGIRNSGINWLYC